MTILVRLGIIIMPFLFIFYYMSSQKQVFTGPKYKIILVGDSGVGKTSIFMRYILGQSSLEQPITTIDFRYKIIELHDKKVKLCIWDTAGQQKFRSIVATYFKSCQGVILIFDVSNPASWENVKNVWYELAFKRAPSANYLLLGNKKDLGSSVPIDDIHKWCTEKGVYYIQTCAVSGEAIEQSFFTLAALIDSREEYLATSSFSTNNISSSFVEETTKEGTKIGTKQYSQKSSVKANYKHQRGESFFLRKGEKDKKSKNCCS